MLVHGSWGDHHSWDGIAPGLARSFRVLTYDRRGHSQSERPGAKGSVREDVADLACLIERLDLAPAHILGNSFGGSIALRLAAQRPDLFRSLLVHKPPLFGLLEEAGSHDALRAFQERVQVVIGLLENAKMEAGARQFAETIAFGPGAWEQLPDGLKQAIIFNAPTFLDEQRDSDWLMIDLHALENFAPAALLTQGDSSEPFFPLVLDKVAQALPRAQRRTLRGVGHLPHLSHPDQYLQVVTSFISPESS